MNKLEKIQLKCFRIKLFYCRSESEKVEKF